MISIETKGMRELENRLKKISKVASDELARVCLEESKKALAKAQEKVPVDTGYLRDTAFATLTKRNKYRSDVRFGYDAPYAGMVHERPATRGYHWFTRAVEASGMAKRILSHVRSRVVMAWRR